MWDQLRRDQLEQRVELQSPFAYLNGLASQEKSASTEAENKTSGPESAGSGYHLASVPTHIGSEPDGLSDTDYPLQIVELTAYPQRSALEPLLTVD